MKRFGLAWIACGLALAAFGCDSSRPVDKCASKDCDDSIACTSDECSAKTGDCEHAPDDSLCAATERCDAAEGCVPLPCEEDVDCDDQLWCTGAETCVDSACVAGDAPDCDDGVACTVDGCDEDGQACTHGPDDAACADGESCDPVAGCVGQAECEQDADCDDGLVCNGAEVCADGSCQVGSPPQCDDQVACTVDTCSEVAGGCESLPDHGACQAGQLCDPVDGCQAAGCADDGECDDGFWCNGAETCDGGSCAPGTFISCDDGIACTLDACDEAADACAATPDDGACAGGQVCDPDQGGCVAGPCSTDADCDDGLFCNGVETCTASACAAGSPPACDDGVACTQDACDAVADACSHQPDHGACSPGELCDPVDGCQVAPCEDDADCDDGLYCNGSEVCSDGSCSGGTAVDCGDGVACTVDSCDEAADACANQPDDGACDDGAWCNGAETCDAAQGCQAGMPPVCDDGVGCSVDSCDEDVDACVSVPDDEACDDGAWCNGAETCDLVQDCQAGTPPNCGDGVGCTVDTCDEGGDSCINTPDDGLCDDADACNGVETCDVLLDCQAGAPVDCDDGVACTVDGCDPQTGDCSWTPDDGLCDDTNPCTTDTCELAVDPAGCVHQVLPDDTSCSDNNVCNGDEVCRGGMCRAGMPLFCSDDNPCTDNFCLPGAGCMTEALPGGTPCPDGDLCNGDEVCDDGATCQPGTPPDCDDQNPCTSDFCLPADGCMQVDNLDPCDDGDACTVLDHCAAGVCAGAVQEICGDLIDNDCDNQTDEDCGGNGTFVAPPPFGNDANPGTAAAPFATVTAGILQAALLGTPQTVFVAGDNSHLYAEDLVMAPGISVLGGYSADGNWDYDPEVYGTVLAPTTPDGVKFFNAGIDRETVLDGFIILGQAVGGQGGLSQAISVHNGAPTISHNTVYAGPAAVCRALGIESGADPLVAGNQMFGGNCQSTSQVVRAADASVDLLGNEIYGGQSVTCVGVLLEQAGSVVVEYNQISGGDAGGGPVAAQALAVGLLATGGFDDLELAYNAIQGGRAEGRAPVTLGVRIDTCGGSEARLISNLTIVGGQADGGIVNDGASFGISVEDDCPVLIQGNDLIFGSTEQTDSGTGIWCGLADCQIEDNGLIMGADDSGAQVRAVGVSCDAGGCASLARNQAVIGGYAPETIGLALGSDTQPVVDDNLILAGWCTGLGIMNDSGVGIWLSGSGAQVTNNIVWGGFCTNGHGVMANHAVAAGGQLLHANINSNYINGGGSPDGFFSVSQGITMTSDGNAPALNDYRNNIVNAGLGVERVVVAETNAGADPRSFDFNDLIGGTLAIYVDEGSDPLQSIGEVNALADTQTGSNQSVFPGLVNELPFGDFHLDPNSPLIDAGTPDGAPDHDFDGEDRPAGNGFDIGADEAG